MTCGYASAKGDFYDHQTSPSRAPEARRVHRRGRGRRQILFGYDSAVINGAVVGIQNHFRVGPVETGVVVAIALLGSAAGAWTGGRLADQLGRTRSMQVAAMLFMISVDRADAAVHDLGSRLLASDRGLRDRHGVDARPAYIAEVAPPAYRGRLGSFQQLAIVLGIAVSQLVNYVIAEYRRWQRQQPPAGRLQAWQWMLGAVAIPALLYVCSP